MNKGAGKISQILLYVIILFLFVFLGSGLYFLVTGLMGSQNTIGSGFVGVGVFLFGLGLIVFLQVGMMHSDASSFFATFGWNAVTTGSDNKTVASSVRSGSSVPSKAPIMQFEGKISVEGSPSAPATYAVYDEGLHIKVGSNREFFVAYADIRSCDRDKMSMKLDRVYGRGDKQRSGAIFITEVNALRLKALEDKIMKSGALG